MIDIKSQKPEFVKHLKRIAELEMMRRLQDQESITITFDEIPINDMMLLDAYGIVNIILFKENDCAMEFSLFEEGKLQIARINEDPLA